MSANLFGRYVWLMDILRRYKRLTFQEIPIGFVKNIGGRANNLYPQEWKIRTSYLSTYSLKGDLG